jgi:hypothetical protein
MVPGRWTSRLAKGRRRHHADSGETSRRRPTTHKRAGRPSESPQRPCGYWPGPTLQPGREQSPLRQLPTGHTDGSRTPPSVWHQAFRHARARNRLRPTTWSERPAGLLRWVASPTMTVSRLPAMASQHALLRVVLQTAQGEQLHPHQCWRHQHLYRPDREHRMFVAPLKETLRQQGFQNLGSDTVHRRVFADHRARQVKMRPFGPA